MSSGSPAAQGLLATLARARTAGDLLAGMRVSPARVPEDGVAGAPNSTAIVASSRAQTLLATQSVRTEGGARLVPVEEEARGGAAVTLARGTLKCVSGMG
jgi:hypothetical protein